MLDLPSNSVLPSPYGRVKRQEGLNLLCEQLSLDELFVAGRGVDREPDPFRRTQKNGTRFDAGTNHTSIRNRGDNQHSIPPCRKRSAPTPELLPGKNGILTKNTIGPSLIHCARMDGAPTNRSHHQFSSLFATSFARSVSMRAN